MAEPEVGEIYEGKVVKTMDFGAFVNFFGPRDGLVHISELASKRVAKVTDVVKEGDIVKVKLLGFDDRGKVRLSMKQVDQQTGEDLSKKQQAEGPAPSTAASSKPAPNRASHMFGKGRLTGGLFLALNGAHICANVSV